MQTEDKKMQPTQGSMAILLIDEDLDFCAQLQELLQEKGCEVLVASDSDQACKNATHKNLCLIVLGTILPRGEAFRLHKWFKQNPSVKKVPHVILDAPPESHLTKGWRREEGMQVDAFDYISRPIKPDFIANQIWKLISAEPSTIKVLIVDDHAVVREGIRTLLSLHKDISIVGEATNGLEAVDMASKHLPDVVLMDIVMPEVNGIEATKKIFTQGLEGVKVLMLSQYDDEQNLTASQEAGAHGFVSKKGASARLLDAVRAVSRNEMPGYVC